MEIEPFWEEPDPPELDPWEVYDLSESVLFDVCWSRTFRDLELTLDYCWDLSDMVRRRPASAVQPVLMRLVGCVWTTLELDRPFAESDGVFVPEKITVGWDVDTPRAFNDVPQLRELLKQGYHGLVLGTYDSTLNLRAIFKKMEIERLARLPARTASTSRIRPRRRRARGPQQAG